MRGSWSGCKVDEDTLVHSVEPREQKAAGEGNISEYKKANKTTAKEEKRHSMYLQQQQTSHSAVQPQLAPAGGAPC
jgi:hypothetical protein